MIKTYQKKIFIQRYKPYKVCLGDTLNEFQGYNARIPTDEHNKEVVNNLTLDTSNLRVQATFPATVELNENFVASKSTNLTFSKERCYFQQ